MKTSRIAPPNAAEINSVIKSGKVASDKIHFTKGQRVLLRGPVNFPFDMLLTVLADTKRSRLADTRASRVTPLGVNGGTKPGQRVFLEHWNDTPEFSIRVRLSAFGRRRYESIDLAAIEQFTFSN